MSQQQHQPDTNDDRASTSRRDALKMAGFGGLAAMLAGGTGSVAAQTGSAGGGSVPDEIAQYQLPVYSGTMSERPDPGVTGREWIIDEEGHDKHGARYVDRGDHWELVDRQFGAVTAEVTDTDSIPQNPRAASGLHHHLGQGRNLTNSRGRTPTDVFAWVLDDAAQNQYEHRDTFESNGVKPAVAVPTNKIGTSGRMTWDQLDELVNDYGWTLLAHGYDEQGLNSLNETQIEDEVYKCMQDFLDHGHVPHMWVYVGGEDGGDTGRAIVSELFPFARGVGTMAQNSTRHPYDLQSFGVDNEDEATIEGHIDDAASNSLPGMLHSHSIIEGTRADETGLQTSTGKIDNIGDYVKNNTSGGWVTTDEWVRYLPHRLVGVPGVGYIRVFNDRVAIYDSNDDPAMISLAGDLQLHTDVIQHFGSGRVDLRGSDLQNVKDGSGAGDLGLEFNGGAGFFVNGSGEIVAVDEAGNTTTIS